MGSIVIPRAWSRFLASLFVLCLLMAAARSSGASSIVTGQEVQLRLKVQPGMDDAGDAQYQVSLRTTSGQYARVADAVRGTRLHFKHLKPDIYVICVKDHLDREQCKSIDMFPSQDGKNHEFTAEITAPMPNTVDAHTVRVGQLKVSGKARQELSLSIKATIQGDSGEMLTHLQRALDIDPSFVEALNNLGFHYFLEGETALSIKYFTKVVELNPDFVAGWSNFAGALLANRQWPEAMKAISRALLLRPDSTSLNSEAAYCYCQLHRYSEAEKYYKKVLELDPESSTFPMLNLARIALTEEREEDAKAYVRLFLKIHPNAPDAPSWMGALRAMESGTLRNAPSVAQDRP